MAIPWKDIAVFEMTNGELAAPWVAVPEELGGITHLKISGEGQWTVAGSLLPSCGPDGIQGLDVKDDRLVLTNCPVGALIGRIGGSSADVVDSTSDSPAADKNTKPFPIGRQCTVVLPAKGDFGALFIGFNTRIRPVQVAQLRVTIRGVKLPAPG